MSGVTMLLALSALALAGSGPTTAPAAPPSAWTVDDVVGMETARGFQISPDGRRVVWEKVRPDALRNRQVTDLYVTSLEDGVEIRLTQGGLKDGAPRWSPDGRLIAFRSARRPPPASDGEADEAEEDGGEEDDGEGEEGESEGGGPSQVWLIDPRGGEAWPLTRLASGVEEVAWLDAGTIVFTARERKSLLERTLREKKDDSVVVEDEEHFPPVRLFTIDVKTKGIRRRTMNEDQIVEFAASPGGRRVVARHHVSPHYEADARAKPRFFLYDMGAAGPAAAREIFTDPLFVPYGFIWANDASGFYCLRTSTSEPARNGPGAEALFWYDLAAGAHREVPLEWPNGLGGFVGYDVTQDGFLALLADGPANRLARFTRRGEAWTRELVDDPKAARADAFEVGPDGAAIVFTCSTASTPRKAYAGRLAGAGIRSQRLIAPVNPSLASKRMSRTEVFRWKGALDDEISGILFYPPDYSRDRRYPLVLMIHGGPNDVDLDTFDESWAYAAHLVAGRGAFVLKPNYHGSSNHGRAFAESIKGRYYEYEIPDILAGIDALDGKGFIDPQRLGVIGWSNGAILTWELIARTGRFKAAAPGAGDVNWTGDYGNCSFGSWFSDYYMGGPPWERAQTYIEKSPYFRLGAVTTPTIIFFGTEDRAVDTGQGWEAYRALQQIGRTKVRFVLFPGEPHTLERPSHQRRKLEEELAWFDRWLFDRPARPNEALKENAPLDLLLKSGRFARDGALLGERHEGVLVPETVPWEQAPGGAIDVGRFEVTRAQYAAFEPSYPAAGALANLPAGGIPFEKARAYCEWLSARTKRRYRLPAAAELEDLIGRAAGDPLAEVTLDSWAGYALSPDDGRRLVPLLGELPGDAPLLKPVGSARPLRLAPGVLLYDLGGNVSEWAVDAGAGKPLGCNAAQPCDRLAGIDSPSSSYTGLRVIRTNSP